jgi:hypothetical protein
MGSYIAQVANCLVFSIRRPQPAHYIRLNHAVCQRDSPAPIHIHGLASRGKAYLLYPVISALRKQDEIVLLSASSAFAAKNYLVVKSDRVGLLHVAKCYVIDEIGGLHFKAFDCADRLMRLLTGKPDRVWGGCMIITVGDFRQVSIFFLSWIYNYI